MNTETNAGSAEPGDTRYEVVYTHGHETLIRGDIVLVAACPVNYCGGPSKLLLRLVDLTLHDLYGGPCYQFVHLRPVEKNP